MWVNKKRLERLDVETFDNVIAFIDKEASETVQVEQTDSAPLPGNIIVNGNKINLVTYPITKGEMRITKRNVYHYVTALHCKALRVGLTVHRSWFSSTPHTFELSPELGFEEVFYFRSSTPGAKALLEGQGLWHDGSTVDAAWPVRDRQLAAVPMGTHRVTILPVEGEGRAELWYWWCYLALPRRGWEKGQ